MLNKKTKKNIVELITDIELENEDVIDMINM